ncbi:hypothetical protein [Desulfuromonas acetoxidans]|uniref:hypothetical protein n=1 Tax=Desulfuromonas acetoxidans TaxID=891 RepID=UPI002931D16B|nr:hypothetical protein [Desulfuromonas acetoxidans]
MHSRVISFLFFFLGLSLGVGVVVSHANQVIDKYGVCRYYNPNPYSSYETTGCSSYGDYWYYDSGDNELEHTIPLGDVLDNCSEGYGQYRREYHYSVSCNYYDEDPWPPDPAENTNGIMDNGEDGIDCGGSTGVDCVKLCQSGDNLFFGDGNSSCAASDGLGVYDPFLSAPGDDYQSLVDSLDPYDENRPTGDDGSSVNVDDPGFWQNDLEQWQDATIVTENEDGSITTTESGGTLSVVDSGSYEYTTTVTETTDRPDGSSEIVETTTATSSGGTTRISSTTTIINPDGSQTTSSSTTIEGDGADGVAENESDTPESSIDGEKIGRFGSRLADFFDTVSGAPVFSVFISVFTPPVLASDSSILLDFGSYGQKTFDFSDYSSTFSILGLILASAAFAYSCRLVFVNRG